jgi:chromosome segregation ATPase
MTKPTTKIDYQFVAVRLRGENDRLAIAWEAAKAGVAQANVEIGRLNAHLNDATKRLEEMQDRIDQLDYRANHAEEERNMLIRAITAVVTR